MERISRRLAAALAASCILGTAAQAQTAQPARPAAPRDHRIAPELREPPGRSSSGMLARLPVGDDAAIGIGRFSVLETSRPATNIERERDPMSIRRREQGIGGVGLRITF